MSTQLEQFIKDHREEFDQDEPTRKVWDNIRQQLDPDNTPPVPVVRFSFLRWSAAAAVVALVAAGIWFFAGSGRNENSKPATAENQPGAEKKPNGLAPSPGDSSTKVQATPLAKASTSDAKRLEDGPEDASLFNEEVYHYAKLVEIKHKELKKIEKDEPLLYKQFAGDVYKLDSVFHILENQLSTNPNREQLLEAMVQNLQLQMGLLNHQLEIIKQINHSKKSVYENAYKTI
jgi:hypothetical protein